MPLYSFAVHNSHRRIESEASELLPDDGAALEEAVGIVRDLKKNNAALWRNGWTIEVTEGDHRVCAANNPQQSWGFEGEPPEAVMKDSATSRWGTL
jgi:hypothetical protein